MGWTLKKILQSIFLDFTMKGERVITNKEYKTDEEGRKYLSRRKLIIEETGEILREDIYSSKSKRPIATHINRPYMLG